MNQWYELRTAVCMAGSVNENPESQYWLMSDAGPSYCWDCAVKARAEEIGLGPLLDPEKPSYLRTEYEEEYFRGIDGGTWYSAQSDGASHCFTCGKMLHYWLTDYGIDEELIAFEENEFGESLYEIAYGIDRLFELVDDDPRRSRVRALAENFLLHARKGNADSAGDQHAASATARPQPPRSDSEGNSGEDAGADASAEGRNA